MKHSHYILWYTACCALLAGNPRQLYAQRKHGEGIPIIMQQPESQAGTNGIATQFTVVAETEPPFEADDLRYKWQTNKAGTAFSDGPDWKDVDAANPQFTGAASNIFTIKEPEKSDVGWYRVQVKGENGGKGIYSEPASLCLYSEVPRPSSTKPKSKTILTLYGPPVATSPLSSGTCPGSYVGYVNFKKALPDWGWSTN